MKFMTFHYRRLTAPWNGLLSQRVIRENRLTHRIDPRGGVTRVEIYGDDGTLLSSGIARCSKQDNYNKKRGRLIAEGRALKGLNHLNA